MKTTTILEEAIKLGRSHDFKENHAKQVSKLALRLFDDLQPLHRMGNSERVWLRLASLWHDIGKNHNDALHHKATRDIIVNKSNLPFKKRVRKIIGLVARYHRGCLPEDMHKHYRRLDDESKQCVRKLAALLRLADALDNGHEQIVRKMSCEITNEHIILNILISDDTNLKKVMRKADLLELTYGREIKIRKLIIN